MRKPLFSRKNKRWGLIISSVLFSSLVLAACGGTSPSIMNPSGPVAGSEAGLFWFILGVATFVFVAVESALIYSIIRFRDRPGAPDAKQFHGNNTVEIIWTVAPSIFLFIVLAATLRTMFGLAQPAGSVPLDQPGGNTLEVRAFGHQWWWEFDYNKSPNYHFVTADSLVVPVNTTVRVDLYSDNVIHSFWVPELAGKTDVIPGHDNHMWFSATQTGTYIGECAEYCGVQHANMNFNVIVKSMDDYKTWVSGQQAAAATAADGSLAAKGATIFKQQCTGCHGIVGVNLSSFDDPKAQVLIGPNLTHFGSRGLIAGGVLDNDPSGKNLRTWLTNPQSVKPGNDMNVNLTQDQIDALIAYLQSLK